MRIVRHPPVPAALCADNSYSASVERTVVGFVTDDAGDWVAKLDCFHRQHVRHNPSFRSEPWVLDDVGRSQRVGTALECRLCDRAELPGGLDVVRATDIWDERTMPAGLRRAHRVAIGTWATLRVEAGQLRFRRRLTP